MVLSLYSWTLAIVINFIGRKGNNISLYLLFTFYCTYLYNFFLFCSSYKLCRAPIDTSLLLKGSPCLKIIKITRLEQKQPVDHEKVD